jgi:hypothetical protein
MFKNLKTLFKRGPSPNQRFAALRDALFMDQPLAAWEAKQGRPEPWASLDEAKRRWAAGDPGSAQAALRGLLAQGRNEGRILHQAWCFLRELGEAPPEGEAGRLLGVVVEVGLGRGIDLVAAYPEGTARYFNFSGAAVIWERPDSSLDGPVQALLAAGQRIAQQSGPWAGPRPGAPPEGQVRLNVLTPRGLQFGQGPSAAIEADPLGGPALRAAFELMKALIAKSEERR